MFSIIIPVFNNHELTDLCLQSIADCPSMPHEVIIVDNGSDPAISGAMIRNADNLGFPIAVNQGIKAASGDVIVILNNDVVVTPNWLERFNYHLQKFDIVGACTNSISGPQQVLIDRYDNKQELYEQASRFQDENLNSFMPFHRVVFFCVAIKKAVIAKIGYLNEVYSPGNFEDDDYCMRAIKSGFKCGIAKDLFVHHFGSSTFENMPLEYGKLIEKNRRTFEAMWPEQTSKELIEENNGK